MLNEKEFNIDDSLNVDDFFEDVPIKTKPKVSVGENQLLLPSGKLITFNEQQTEALERIKKWLKTDKQFFTLEGFAGTGKSTIVKKVLDTYRYGVVVSAPTHQARKIISNTTGREGKTLHSLLGLRPDLELPEYNPNALIFSAIAPPKINDYNWVVLDEGSQVNSYLFELMHKLIIGKRTKLLIMGDRAQLPPIQQVISPVFTHPDIERYQLTKVERQSDDNPLMPVYDALRDNLNSVDGGFVRKTNLNNNGDGIIITIDKKKFREMVLEKFKSEEYKKDSDFVKGLAWKNDTVMSSNKVVRDELFGKTADIVEVDDVLRGYRTVTNEKQNYNIIENSADYKVMSKSIVRENAYGISGYDVKLREDIGKGKFKFDDVFIIDSNDHENLHLYAQMHDFFRDMGKTNKKAWRKYYEFRRCNLLMVNIEKHKSGILRSSSDIINRDIYYGYFITVHKAQGSTYTNCIVMDTDINLNWDIVERNKLRYVALSRPTSKAIVLTTKIDV